MKGETIPYLILFFISTLAGIYFLCSSRATLLEKKFSEGGMKIEKALRKNFISISGKKAFLVAGVILTGIFALAFLTSSLFASLILLSSLPVMLMGGMRIYQTSRRRKVIRSLPHFLNLLETELLTGTSLIQALRSIETSLPPPLRDEVSLINSSISLGLSPDDALEILSRRIPSEETLILVLTMRVAIRNGTNLAAVAREIRKTLIQRERMTRKMKAMTSQGKTQGIVISLVPPLLIVSITRILPGYGQFLFHTSQGKTILSISGTLIAVGWLLIWKITRPEV
ncbi:MAG: hypothetical protein D6713_03510 [Deltaproteobacteria bacterium]|nr:MAG: hypothetical protein D6713_03510 [Deltaproteobacteria bacterium]